MSKSQEKQQFPPQEQEPPGTERRMRPDPQSEMKNYRGGGKLSGKVALVTGADSGIGRAVAIGFAKEGADVAIAYLSEHGDAEETRKWVEKAGRKALTLAGNIGVEAFCRQLVQKVVAEFGRIDILVNNAAMQRVKERLEDISEEQLDATFRTNIYSQFFLAKAALPHMQRGSVIINTTSVTAYRGQPKLLDYSSTKGAILAFTRALAQNLAERGIRVNAVAPGPIWTPLIPSSFSEEHVKTFGSDTAMGRAGQPDEVAPSYIFLASDDSSYFTGHVLHPDGGAWFGD
jgi:NAD(P)-dependent dehydrogenase (short-subunit alcohol dehydrogenase family)